MEQVTEAFSAYLATTLHQARFYPPTIRPREGNDLIPVRLLKQFRARFLIEKVVYAVAKLSWKFEEPEMDVTRIRSH